MQYVDAATRSVVTDVTTVRFCVSDGLSDALFRGREPEE